MEVLVVILMGALAVWRVTHMFQEENGPGAVFEKLRAKIWPLEDKSGSFREGFFCFKCMSVWVACILALLLWLLPVVFFIIALPASLSAIAIFVNEWYNKE